MPFEADGHGMTSGRGNHLHCLEVVPFNHHADAFVLLADGYDLLRTQTLPIPKSPGFMQLVLRKRITHEEACPGCNITYSASACFDCLKGQFDLTCPQDDTDQAFPPLIVRETVYQCGQAVECEYRIESDPTAARYPLPVPWMHENCLADMSEMDSRLQQQASPPSQQPCPLEKGGASGMIDARSFEPSFPHFPWPVTPPASCNTGCSDAAPWP